MKKKMSEVVEPVYITIGARIRAIRMAKGFSKENVGDAVGVSASHIGGIEEGRSRFALHYVADIAKVFGLSPEDLLNGVWL